MKPSPADLWSHSICIGARRVYVFERPDRAGLFLKFTSPEKRGRDRRVTKKLPGSLSVRSGNGRVDPKLEREVLRAVERIAVPLLSDEVPLSASPRAEPLTLSRGFDLALDLDTGKYPSRTLRYQEVERARRKLERILGASARWIELTPGQVRSVWRTLAVEYKKAGASSRRCGPRQAEVTVDALYSVAAWLREEGLLAANALPPMTKWRAKLKQEWAQLVDHAVEPSRPRHSPEEMGRLFRHMHDDEVDPRFALAFDLGGEQRMGQVLRARRSQLELPIPAGKSEDAGGLGLFRVLGAGHKTTSPIALTPEQRRSVDDALAGYLAAYEAEYRAGRIRDYPLFPAGRLRARKANLVLDPKPLTRDAALKMFRELEGLAGVDHVKGRGWYGVRRIAADVAEDIEKDERVLNAITGHRDSMTRRSVYQQQERPAVLQQAARTRTAARLSGLTLQAKVNPPLDAP